MVSVIVPIYNSAAYLQRCVDSIRNQSYRNWELLLIDDGSTDNSAIICKKKSQEDERIYYYSKPNGGVSSARNLGLKYALGEYVIFVDSDDWLVPEAIRMAMDKICSVNTDCVVWGMKQRNNHVWAPIRSVDYECFEDFLQDLSFWLNSELLSPVFNKIFRRAKITHYFNESMSYGEDLVFCLKYLSNCEKVSFITDALYQHNLDNEGSITHKFQPERFFDIEHYHIEILRFAGDGIVDGLTRKYLKDILYQIKSLCNSELKYTEKKSLLSQWFESSYLKKMEWHVGDDQSRIDVVIYGLLSHRMFGTLIRLFDIYQICRRLVIQ